MHHIDIVIAFGIFCGENRETIEESVRPKHFNPQSTKKGNEIFSSSGTTLPAYFAEISNRREWTVSMMFEVNLGFVELCVQYLGKLLAYLMPNEASFSVLLPRFTCGI